MKTFAILLLAAAVGSAAMAAETKPVVDGNTQFALELYNRLAGRPGNLFCSPYSISTALAMTCGGARGQTEKQMAGTLHFPGDPTTLHPAFAQLEAGLNAVQQKGKVKLSVANSLWPHNKHPFLPAYLALLKQNYGATVTPCDYAKAAEPARQQINRWVEDMTNQKIKDLIPSGALDSMTRLVLVNAIYFKGNWAAQFAPKATTNQPFHLADGKDVKAPLMFQKRKFGYAEADNLQILRLPYAGNDLSMIVLLPRAADGLPALEKQLTVENLAKWTARLPNREVEVFLPKFKMTSQFGLNDTLAALGMTDAFTGKADFSGMDGQRDLFISAVIHKAFVEVNEEGTEAAAATGAVMTTKMAMPDENKIFRADHPFLFLIRDNATGSILFIGRVADPTK